MGVFAAIRAALKSTSAAVRGGGGSRDGAYTDQCCGVLRSPRRAGSVWYRFPSHFFIPNRRIRVRFIPDGFHVLLPKYYDEKAEMGSRVHQAGMNMFTKEDPEQWFHENAVDGCHFIVNLD